MKITVINTVLSKNPLPALLALFLLIGAGYSYYTPLWNTPDEERHFAYCEYIAHHHTLPDYVENPQGNSVTMAFHPPLYYLVGSLFFGNDHGLLEELIATSDEPGYTRVLHPENTRDALYAKKARIAYMLRFFSLLLSGVTLWSIYRSALIIFSGDVLLASFCVLFVATIPQFSHISAAVSNDSITTATASAYILVFLCLVREPRRMLWQVLCGILLGLCLLSKTSTLILLPFTLLCVSILSLRSTYNPAPPLIAITGISAVVAGWWYVRNWLFFDDPMLSKTAFANNPMFLPRMPLSIDYWGTVAVRTFVSYFGDFGSLQFTISDTHLAVYGGILLLSTMGMSLAVAKKKIMPSHIPFLWVFSLLILCHAVLLLYLNIQYSGFFMGRYSYTILIPTTILIAWGLHNLFPPRLRRLFFALLAILLVTMNCYSLLAVVKPAYAETFLSKAVDQPAFLCPSPNIGADMRISQSFICRENNLCAIRVMASCTHPARSGELFFVLKEAGGSAEELYRIAFPLEKINDFNRYCFFFPPIKDSSGKEYVFSFQAPSQGSDKAVSLWYEPNDPYQDGSMQLNTKPSGGDLHFQVYSFTGSTPETDWQGRRAVGMDGGWYITIPELQLYYEQSPDFRVTTQTHAKLLRLKKALRSRKSLTECRY